MTKDLSNLYKQWSDVHFTFSLFSYYSTHYSIFGNIFDGHQTFLPDAYVYFYEHESGRCYLWCLVPFIECKLRKVR